MIWRANTGFTSVITKFNYTIFLYVGGGWIYNATKMTKFTVKTIFDRTVCTMLTAGS